MTIIIIHFILRSWFWTRKRNDALQKVGKNGNGVWWNEKR